MRLLPIRNHAVIADFLSLSSRATVSIFVVIMIPLMLLPANVSGASDRQLHGFLFADFTLLNPDTMTLVGRARLNTVKSSANQELVRVEYKFTNGTHDVDEDWLRLGPDDKKISLVKYKHTFFNSDNNLDLINEADMISGHASCTRYLNGQPETLRAVLEFSHDTYAGPAIILPVRDFVQNGNQSKDEFHYFSCSPSPKLYVIRMAVQQDVHRNFHHGALDEVDLQPQFGILNFLMSAFVPEVKLWFDPARNFELVAAQSVRYFRGPKFLMVRQQEQGPLR
jgi:hypothetical protein